MAANSIIVNVVIQDNNNEDDSRDERARIRLDKILYYHTTLDKEGNFVISITFISGENIWIYNKWEWFETKYKEWEQGRVKRHELWDC